MTCAADRTNIVRIFFLDNGGFATWLAYILVLEGKAHFNGRLKRNNIFKAF
jgi:hypothetical protein